MQRPPDQPTDSHRPRPLQALLSGLLLLMAVPVFLLVMAATVPLAVVAASLIWVGR